MREIAGDVSGPIEIWEGQGCEECSNTGYRGRSGIYELLLVGDNIRPLILKRSSADIIRDAGIKMGMRTLREDGWQKVRTGVTTVGEVVRVTQEEV
jgi:type II secretory ATPase GspE/PulE/Tfp pilus assembly ATPase PilB-like protein